MTSHSAPFSHADFAAFLARHVDDEGRVDYVAASADRADLDRYLAAVAVASPDRTPERFPTEDARLAYWINAYNASVISVVLAHYPIESVQDVRAPLVLRWLLPRGAGFFGFERLTFGGATTSLYYLEHRVIRKRFAEPRVHFALNCASRGCPRLPPTPFTAEGLSEELERETREFFAETRNARFDPEARTLHLSSILDWFEGDFMRWLETEHPTRTPSLLEYVRLHAPSALRDQLAGCDDCAVAFVPYDWSLNDRRSAP